MRTNFCTRVASGLAQKLVENLTISWRVVFCLPSVSAVGFRRDLSVKSRQGRM